MKEDCKAKTADEIRKVSPDSWVGVDNEVILALWDDYYHIDSEGFRSGPCYCELYDYAKDRDIRDFTRWATNSPLKLATE